MFVRLFFFILNEKAEVKRGKSSQKAHWRVKNRENLFIINFFQRVIILSEKKKKFAVKKKVTTSMEKFEKFL
jgi:hypothetical protein